MSYKWLQALLALAFAVDAGSQTVAVPPAEYRPGPLSKAQESTSLLTASGAPRFSIDLAVPSQQEKAQLTSQPARARNKDVAAGSGKGRPLQVGFTRIVPSDARTMPMTLLPWQATADGGKAARVEIRSPGAAAIRLGVTMPATHPDVAFRFVGSDRLQQVFGPYPGNQIAQATLFWSPVLEGEKATMEIYLPPGLGPESVQVGMPQISHLVMAGISLQKAQPVDDIGRSGACEIDVKCATPTAALVNQAKAVAKMLFTTSEGSFICTGTVMNDSVQSFTPYFYTASHCIDSQQAASSLNTYWFFDAIACNNRTAPPYQLVAGGGMLLGRSEDFDWAIVRMNNAPPAGTYFSAWRAEVLATGATVDVVHHPEGDLKKWSRGTHQGIFTFSDNSTYWRVNYQQGSTEEGSSGSALLSLSGDGTFYELRGGLYAGDASCSVPNGNDYYSRLDIALPLMRQYLTPNAANPTNQTVVVEFYNSALNHYFISGNAAEINDLDTGVHPGWVRTGLRFLAYSSPSAAPGAVTPVCRFYIKPEFGDSHFYSASPAECAATQANFGDRWVYESAAVFYILLPNTTTGACAAGTHAVYRFFNPATTNHRYTAEVDLRDDLIAQGGLIQEGYGNPPNQVIMCTPDT